MPSPDKTTIASYWSRVRVCAISCACFPRSVTIISECGVDHFLIQYANHGTTVRTSYIDRATRRTENRLYLLAVDLRAFPLVCNGESGEVD